ncbi:MAG: sirohydrochlorin cobaltochelatase [Lacrimispora saccharolytica]|nr:sirohydrochlorin cobaltochelatase [Lachnospiraceae bacterium]
METQKTALLAVSFGTSFHDTREKTIDQIENALAEAFPEAHLYRAWTSGMILKKIQKRDGIHIDNVKEAMERMIADGVTDLIVQPTHVINGIENDQMKEDVMAYASSLHSVSFGTPLLTTTEDNEETIRAVMKEWNLSQDEVLVFMGHGTTHYANTVYAALDYTFKDLGYKNVYMGTVEAYPSLESLLRQIHAYQPKKVHLAPFMIVAGDHASNDMSSEDPDSWKSQFEAEGFTVECHMKGLGEYRGIRDIFIRHAKEAAQTLQ